ncbi:hypothetical protein DPEC_G00328770 [Dallia pectoralis]|uniref:Uncharacterized protein n=1 Tax=Dallia pectoralis TaxID=75939 RepID=A0ACC2F8H0_DALPE|nr:hypothetical protein DPEC_G00328770 [Dallia pectoralis]
MVYAIVPEGSTCRLRTDKEHCPRDQHPVVASLRVTMRMEICGSNSMMLMLKQCICPLAQLWTRSSHSSHCSG